MIPNQWYAVLDASEVKGKPVGVTRLGEKLVFWRNSRGVVTAQRDLCPHRGVALSAGKVVGDHIQCPFHGFEYETNGQCTLIPANSVAGRIPKGFDVHTYPTREAHGFIWVWWGERPESGDLPPLNYFDNLEGFDYTTTKDHWTVHYSRAIENQLDLSHLPFVHHNTIGRGGQAVVDGPVVELDEVEQAITFWVHNRVEDGTPPRKAEDIPNPKDATCLQFRFPNVWQNNLGDKLRIVVAFAPIDEENTLLYLRLYQRMVKAPVLKQLFNFVSTIVNLIILRQDKRVVLTQRPKRTAFRMRERLVQSDLPITAYRKHRRKLIKEAGGEEADLLGAVD